MKKRHYKCRRNVIEDIFTHPNIEIESSTRHLHSPKVKVCVL